MLVQFFFELREAGVPVSITEFLMLLEALRERVAQVSAQDFYYLARACLVKDERHYDRFDRVFAASLRRRREAALRSCWPQVPAEWLQASARACCPRRRSAAIEALGGWDKLLETLRERLREQKERHEGGNKWIGTGGTSPFGAQRLQPRRDPHRPGRLAATAAR